MKRIQFFAPILFLASLLLGCQASNDSIPLMDPPQTYKPEVEFDNSFEVN